jgi:anti-sigma factor RsiW
MNDEFGLMLEQYFDGEFSADREAECARLVAQDYRARNYLDRLARLRALARRHKQVRCAVTPRPS